MGLLHLFDELSCEGGTPPDDFYDVVFEAIALRLGDIESYSFCSPHLEMGYDVEYSFHADKSKQNILNFKQIMLLLHSKRQKMAESLKDKTAKGLFWGAMNSGSTQVLNILFGIFLARLLSPSDYGVIGVLTIFTVIAGNLQSSGFTQALVNLEKPTHRDYNSVF